MNRLTCVLPNNMKGLCEMGCIYREKAFKHLACPTAKKMKIFHCVAPCPKGVPLQCGCKTEIKVLTKKEKNEVFLL